MVMTNSGTIYFENTLSVKFSCLEDGSVEFEFSNSGTKLTIKEFYDFHLKKYENDILLWCADKVKLLKGDSMKIIEIIERDFVSDIFLVDDFFLVCDTHIIARDIDTLQEKRVYFHEEIIGNCILDRKMGQIIFSDINNNSFSYRTLDGTVLPYEFLPTMGNS
jgi:hypothetical protein